MGTRRLIVLDHNVSGIGGHFSELASVIIEGGVRLGLEPWLVSHKNLNLQEIRGGDRSDPTARILDELSLQNRILPVFTVAKMHRWSLASSGHSRLCRDPSGIPRSAGLKSSWQYLVDRLHKESPQWMMRQYVSTITSLFQKLKPTSDDIVLFATCEDFNVLSAASAIHSLRAACSLNLHFLFHPHLIDQRQGHWRHRGYCNREFVLQMEQVKDLLKTHRSNFWATTAELADQLNLMTMQFCDERKSQPKTFWHSIDYPVRQEFSPTDKPMGSPKRLIMGGKVRTEKGAKDIRQLVSSIWDSQLATGNWQLCLQTSGKNARKYLPKRALSHINQQSASNEQVSPIEFLPGKLSASAYASMIHSADAGLFMYDSRKYYARCSGVLVEMLSAGIPVIVPSGCWLSRQIAREVSQWMGQINVGSILFEHEGTRTLRGKSVWAEFSFDATDAQAIMVEVHLASQQSDDYLGIQLQQSSPKPAVETNYCEVFDDAPVRSCFGIKPLQRSCKLRIGLPYKQRDLTIQRIVVRKVASVGGTQPTSTIGLMAASTQEIPRLLDELGSAYGHYRSTAIEHSRGYRERHSGLTFVTRMLGASAAD